MSTNNPTHAGTLIYRCRLCGGEAELMFVANVARALEAVGDDRSEPSWKQPKYSYGTHHCQDGRLGLMDLVGGRRDGTGGTDA